MDRNLEIIQSACISDNPHCCAIGADCREFPCHTRNIIDAVILQCEADTIRRCAAIVEHEMNFDDVRTDTRVLAAVSRVEIAIFSLLPKEPGHD